MTNDKPALLLIHGQMGGVGKLYGQSSHEDTLEISMLKDNLILLRNAHGFSREEPAEIYNTTIILRYQDILSQEGSNE